MDYFERLVQYIAWNEEFYQSLKNDYPDIITDDYKTTFYQWRREFTATWQELVEESPDKRRESDSKVIQQAIALFSAVSPQVDSETVPPSLNGWQALLMPRKPMAKLHSSLMWTCWRIMNHRSRRRLMAISSRAGGGSRMDQGRCMRLRRMPLTTT